MKIFISWSGEKSRRIALMLREWFPNVLNAVEPFVSSEDIAKGSRWVTIQSSVRMRGKSIQKVTRKYTKK